MDVGSVVSARGSSCCVELLKVEEGKPSRFFFCGLEVNKQSNRKAAGGAEETSHQLAVRLRFTNGKRWVGVYSLVFLLVLQSVRFCKPNTRRVSVFVTFKLLNYFTLFTNKNLRDSWWSFCFLSVVRLIFKKIFISFKNTQKKTTPQIIRKSAERIKTSLIWTFSFCLGNWNL